MSTFNSILFNVYNMELINKNFTFYMLLASICTLRILKLVILQRMYNHNKRQKKYATNSSPSLSSYLKSRERPIKGFTLMHLRCIFLRAHSLHTHLHIHIYEVIRQEELPASRPTRKSLFFALHTCFQRARASRTLLTYTFGIPRVAQTFCKCRLLRLRAVGVVFLMHIRNACMHRKLETFLEKIPSCDIQSDT